MSKNEKLKFIKKTELEKIFSLTESEVINLLLTFNIKTENQLTKNTLKGMLSYLKLTKRIEKNINLDKLKYIQNLEVQDSDTNDSLENKIKKLQIENKIKRQEKEAKKKSIIKKRNKNINDISNISNDLIIIKNSKEASKVYNNGYIVYYTRKNKQNSILCKMDTTKTFSANVSNVSSTKYYSDLKYYTKYETFDISKIEKVIPQKGRIWTKQEDKIILDFYNSKHYASSNKKTKNKEITLKDLSKEFNISSCSIRKRAIELGFTNFKKPRDKVWTEEEIQLLKECAGKYNPKKISKIFKEKKFIRSDVAITIKLKRLKCSLKLDGRVELNLRMLSSFMGVDPHFFYENNRIEKLKGIEENNQWIFTRENVSKYLIENPYDYSLGKVEPKWFIEIIKDTKRD